MDTRVSWSPEALDDVDSIAAYIAKDSPFYASAVVKKILDTAESLGKFPYIGPIVGIVPAVIVAFVVKGGWFALGIGIYFAVLDFDRLRGPFYNPYVRVARSEVSGLLKNFLCKIFQGRGSPPVATIACSYPRRLAYQTISGRLCEVKATEDLSVRPGKGMGDFRF